jgi:hypothetical protein
VLRALVRDDATELTFHNELDQLSPRDGELVLWRASVPTRDGYVNITDYHDWDLSRRT